MSDADPNAHQPDTPALAVGDDFWSDVEVAGRVSGLAVQLADQGLRAGQVVLRAADDPVELLLLQFALASAGAGLLPYGADLSAMDLDSLAADVGAEWHWQHGAPVPTGHGPPANAGDRIAPALLVRTSGSSGAPKTVMLMAGQLIASAARVNGVLGLRRDDQWLCCLPLSHIGGLAIGWRCALARAAVRLAGAWRGPGVDGRQAGDHAGLGRPGGQLGAARGGFDAGQVAATLATYPVTHLSLVPAMLARLLDVMPAPPPSLRVLLLGGQALHPALARRAMDAGWPLHVSYGMSETGSMVAVGRWRDDPGPGSRVGPLLADAVPDCAGPAAPPRRLRLRGPMLMAGYGNPARRPGIGLDAGWLGTADLCRLDADGALRVFGRADELLVIGGEQVSPGAVEARLAAAPGVREVVVVGVPHPVWGATLAACWSGAATPAALAAWCRAGLPGRERPRIFRRYEALPLLSSGKPDRAALRAAVASQEHTAEDAG
jgi:O-succinylbenzoic acid--CoA ligase